VLVVAFPPPGVAAQAAPGAARSVLVFEGEDPVRPFYVAFISSLRERLTQGWPQPVTIYAETLDLGRFGGEEYERQLLEWYAEKYRGVRPDVLVAGGVRTLALIVRWRDRLWPGVPIVVTFVDPSWVSSRTLPPDIRVITTDLRPDSTFALARRLVPGLKAYGLVGDRELSGTLGDFAQRQVIAAAGSLPLIDLRGLTPAGVRRRLAAMPDSTLVIDMGIVRDSSGRRWTNRDALTQYAPASRVPILGFAETLIGYGLTAGRVIDPRLVGAEVADRVLDLLQGRDDGPAWRPSRAWRVIADARELARLRIPLSRLPDGAEVRFREEGPLQRYWKWIVAAAALLALQTAMIVALLVSRRQRRVAQQELEQRLRFEALLGELSAELREVRPDVVDARIDLAMARLARLAEADAAAAGLLHPDGRTLELRQRWTIDRSLELPDALGADELPASASAELEQRGVLRDAVGGLGMASTILVPLAADGTLLGALLFGRSRRATEWLPGLVEQLRVAANVIASAIARTRADEAARKSDAFSSAMIASAAGSVAIVDDDGRIVRRSEGWDRNGDSAPLARGAESEDYLAALGAVDGPLRGEAASVRDGVVAVLRGDTRRFVHEYEVPGDESAHWFATTVERFDSFGGGAVVAHIDVSSRRRAEAEAHAKQQQVEHVTRVAAVSDLAAAVAHQLNQPLGAILSNAQAGAKMIGGGSPSLDELTEILEDIQADDRRATEIIREFRDLLRRQEHRPGMLDVNAEVGTVHRLLAADAAARNVELQLDLEPLLPAANGDRVQFQQVLINLVTNALQATQGMLGRRLVTVSTRRSAGGVDLRVADTGAGFAVADPSQLFEPFYTSKPTGLGLGLSICRSIVEAAGGQIHAAPGDEGGAVFSVFWPAATPSTADA
jgi:signal transduction histidine kinase